MYTLRRWGSASKLTWTCAPIGIRPGTGRSSPCRLEPPARKSRSDGSAAEVQLASGTAGHEPRPPARAAIQTSATLPALAPAPTVPSQESTAERRPRAVDPPTSAPTCVAAERRHLGVWSACAAESQCIAPHCTARSHRCFKVGVRLHYGARARGRRSLDPGHLSLHHYCVGVCAHWRGPQR